MRATFWGGFAGGALLLGAVIGYYMNMKQRTIAAVMAFGSGVLISALAFELMEQAYEKGGFIFTATGFIAGAVIYSGANILVAKQGGRHRKRSNVNALPPQPKNADDSGVAIAIGALIDGIPESIVIGLGMIEGGSVSIVAVAAIFISNIPEGLSSSVGMKRNGKTFAYVAKTWIGITILSAFFAWLGYFGFKNVPIEYISAIMAVAAGAILAMIVDTMIPEAFEETHDLAGLVTVFGFLAAFALDKLG